MFPLWLVKQCIIKTYDGVEGYLHEFFTSPLDGREWSACRSCLLTPSVLGRLGGNQSWSGLVGEEESLSPCQELNLGHRVHSSYCIDWATLVTIHKNTKISHGKSWSSCVPTRDPLKKKEESQKFFWWMETKYRVDSLRVALGTHIEVYRRGSTEGWEEGNGKSRSLKWLLILVQHFESNLLKTSCGFVVLWRGEAAAQFEIKPTRGCVGVWR
jgi:hypothetical protein